MSAFVMCGAVVSGYVDVCGLGLDGRIGMCVLGGNEEISGGVLTRISGSEGCIRGGVMG